MHIRRHPSSIALTLALPVALVFGALNPVAAQQPAPTATALPATPVPTVAPPTVIATPGPLPTPTPTIGELFIELIFGKDRAAILSELWQRLWWLAVLAGVLVVAIPFVWKPAGEWMQEGIKARLKRAQGKSGLAVYFDWLQEELKHLPIIPIRSTKRQEQLLLQDVYVPLRVVERVQIEGFRRLIQGDFDPAGEYQVRKEAFEALEGSRGVYRLLSEPEQLTKLEEAGVQQRRARRPVGRESGEAVETTTTRLLLVGDAGSGKTTTLQYGALVLAHDCRTRSTDAMRKHLDLHAARVPVPFYIRLTLVATYVREAQQRARSDELPALQGAPSNLLLDWLDSYTSAQVTKRGATIDRDFPSHRIAAGGCLIMLDGLDETGDTRERDYMQRLITNLVQDYPKNRYLVASRPFEDLHLPGFEERHLSPLNRNEIEQLLRNWFGAVHKSSARRSDETVADQVAYLCGILDHNARLFEMATNPLLLTSMALLVHTGVGLPRERAELYNRLIYLLLDTWRTQQITGGVPGRDDRRTRYGGEESASGVQRRLQELAAWMQEQGRRELHLREAQQILRPIYKELKQWDEDQADDYVANLLESLALESGLIQRRDDGYSFAHYTLQEYLTARACDLRADGVQALYQNRTKPRWRETILLAVGHWATGGQPEKARQLLQMLLEDPGSSTGADDALPRKLIGVDVRETDQIDAVLLAAQALDDADAGRVVELAPLRDITVARLRACAFQPQAYPDPALRNRAATMLDRLDADTERPGLDLTKPDYWANRIEPGTFSMGDDKGRFDFEKPQFDYTIRRPYALARFPVTNRQYLLFVESLAGRGAPEAVAAANRLKDLMKQHGETPETYNGFRPYFWPGARYRAGEGNHPVVSVTWYAATAFAWWVNAWLRALGVLKEGEEVRLPTEAEWERAAAYPPTLPGGDSRAGRREYPWGAELTTATKGSITMSIQANTSESGIDGTSVVGIFPYGAAACGAEELSGNVWEWCSTPPLKYPFTSEVGAESLYTKNKRAGGTYVLRGGSWVNSRVLARCACRDDNNPDDAYVNFGFRLARLFSLPSS